MAFDGITIANLVWEFKHTLEGGKIAKIAQPERTNCLSPLKITKKTIACRFCQCKPASYLSYSKQ